MKRGVIMSLFEKHFPRRTQGMEQMEQQAWLIYEELYEVLQRLVNEKYDASINDLVVCAVGHLVETEDIRVFATKNNFMVKRSFRIPSRYNEALERLKRTYNISKNKLINIAIYNAIREEMGL